MDIHLYSFTFIYKWFVVKRSENKCIKRKIISLNSIIIFFYILLMLKTQNTEDFNNSRFYYFSNTKWLKKVCFYKPELILWKI